jgi:deoxyribonuclease-1
MGGMRRLSRFVPQLGTGNPVWRSIGPGREPWGVLKVQIVLWFCLAWLLVGPVVAGAGRAAYLDTIPVFWRTLYPDGGRGLYCGEPFAPHDRAYNIEHVFPMSWVIRELRCGDRDRCRRTSERFNRIESDMHNLYPARKELNQARGAYRYGEIAGERPYRAGCDFELDPRARVVEPRPEARGEIARAMLYMERQHGMPLYRRTRALMERWHREDPPGPAERLRNDLIERVQGNRNPYVDADP